MHLKYECKCSQQCDLTTVGSIRKISLWFSGRQGWADKMDSFFVQLFILSPTNISNKRAVNYNDTILTCILTVLPLIWRTLDYKNIYITSFKQNYRKWSKEYFSFLFFPKNGTYFIQNFTFMWVCASFISVDFYSFFFRRDYY